MNTITPRAPEIFVEQVVHSHIHGYNVKDKSKFDLLKTFETPGNWWCIPAEVVRVHTFSSPPTENGDLETQLNIPLQHVVEVVVLFPTDPYARTVFLNPQLELKPLKILDQSFPDSSFDSTSNAFFRTQLQCNQLDTLLQCSESYEDSYCLTYSTLDGERFKCSRDITNFAWSQRIEILSSNSFNSNGANTDGNRNTIIGISASKRKPRKNEKVEDVYYSCGTTSVEDMDGSEIFGKKLAHRTNTCPPVLCFVSNTYFMFRRGSLGSEVAYETVRSWEQMGLGQKA
jgi:hypothetical protein